MATKAHTRTSTETKFLTFGDPQTDPFHLTSGECFGPITLAYETYGELSAAGDNAVLVFHAFSGSQHAAGFNPEVPGVGELWTDECQTGWWDTFIGPRRALDTRDLFVICANYIGGCYGSTGPGSINPATGRPFGGQFPVLTFGDVVNTQLRLLDHLGIEKLLCVVGASLGGMLSIDFAINHPDRVQCVIPIASGVRATTLHKLYNFEQIFAIEEDPNFNYGDYYDGEPPRLGMMLARMIAHKTFVHLHLMEDRSRGEIVQNEGDLKGYRLQHRIESYMLHQGKKFVRRFDANTYLRIINMWQQFDLTADGSELADALAPARGQEWLVFSIDSDVCYWPEEQEELCHGLRDAGVKHRHITVHSQKGHDSFLLEPELYTPSITYMLEENLRKRRLV